MSTDVESRVVVETSFDSGREHPCELMSWNGPCVRLAQWIVHYKMRCGCPPVQRMICDRCHQDSANGKVVCGTHPAIARISWAERIR